MPWGSLGQEGPHLRGTLVPTNSTNRSPGHSVHKHDGHFCIQWQRLAGSPLLEWESAGRPAGEEVKVGKQDSACPGSAGQTADPPRSPGSSASAASCQQVISRTTPVNLHRSTKKTHPNKPGGKSCGIKASRTAIMEITLPPHTTA